MKGLLSLLVLLVLFTSFKTRKRNKYKLPEEFVYIPPGTIHIDTGAGVGFHGERMKTVSISSFYISRYEVTNRQFRQCIEESGSLLPGEIDLLWDSTGWRKVLGYSQPMNEYYHRHPAYDNYPVVNVSYQGAVKYCQWLQDKISAANPACIVEVKLPEKNQWIYAASGGRSQAMFPWKNYYLRNKKGEFMCNFKSLGDQAIIRDRVTGKPVISGNAADFSKTYFTATVKSYYPNDYGLYNMCGNASEMVAERPIAMGGSWNDYGGDIHILAETRYEDSAPTIGFRPIIVIKQKDSK